MATRIIRGVAHTDGYTAAAAAGAAAGRRGAAGCPAAATAVGDRALSRAAAAGLPGPAAPTALVRHGMPEAAGRAAGPRRLTPPAEALPPCLRDSASPRRRPVGLGWANGWQTLAVPVVDRMDAASRHWTVTVTGHLNAPQSWWWRCKRMLWGSLSPWVVGWTHWDTHFPLFWLFFVFSRMAQSKCQCGYTGTLTCAAKG